MNLIPANEEARLRSLYSYNILGSIPEEEFDDITRIAAHLCDVNMSLISLTDKEYQWTKSSYGTKSFLTPRKDSFCAHAILNPDKVMLVPDSHKDERFVNNPYVTSEPFVRFYAGVPLVTSDGFALGTLCIFDQVPKNLTSFQLESLKALGRQVVARLELKRSLAIIEAQKKDLEFAYKELDSFVSVVAHDINAPLARVTGLAELLKSHMESFPAEHHKTIEYLHLSSSEISLMVKKILEFSRNTSWSLSDMEEIQLPDFFLRIVSLLPKPRKFAFQFPESGTIYYHRSALQQIFLNLFSNAFKYNDKDETILTVTFSTNSEYNFFEVKDNGMGMPPQMAEKAFDLFFQGAKSKDGLGIGLATVKKIIEKSGGKISVDSVPGKGTSFKFSLKRLA